MVIHYDISDSLENYVQEAGRAGRDQSLEAECYVLYSDNDLQIIWGYLQIGKIITDANVQRKYSWHPHSIEERVKESSNVMFVASDKLSFNKKDYYIAVNNN